MWYIGSELSLASIRTKGVDVLLRAAQLVLRAAPQIRFVIVGDGPERSALEALASDLGISAQIEFCGPRLDGPALVASLDILVIPSRTEGTPLVISEAWGSKVPVVAARVGGIPERVVHNLNGLLFPGEDFVALASALEDLISSPARIAALVCAGQHEVSSRGPSEVLATIERTYSAAEHSRGALPSIAEGASRRAHRGFD